MAKTVLLIGGGLGSLSTAIRLSHLGFKVKLFEKNQSLGGKINRVVMNSYTFDTGPTLLTMPWIIDELFQFIGKRREELIQFIPVDPICRYFFPDGSLLDASSDPERMHNELNKFSPDEVTSFTKFLGYSEKIYTISNETFLKYPIHEFTKFISIKNLSTFFQIYKIDPFRTVHNVVSHFFSDRRIIQFFDRFTTYVGSNPYKAPATLNVIAYIENRFGGFYIKGGFYRLISVLQNIADEMGIEIHTNVTVDAIHVKNGRVQGLEIAGESLAADFVICGADVTTAYNDLIPDCSKKKKLLNRLEPSLSGMLFLWGVNNKHNMLEQHNVIFSSYYKKEFDNIFTDLQPPDDPTIYISLTCRKDTHHSQANGENWYVLLNMPYLDQTQNWDYEKSRMRSVIFNKLQHIGISIENHIEVEKIYTPLDFQNQFLGNRGSIYGLSSNSRMSAFKRPPNRSREIKGLYFTGGSTHPGGGIPLVILSGKMVTELIAEQEGIKLNHFTN